MADESARGAVGEEATAPLLERLPDDTWTVLHDLRWPGRRCADVDHVVIGPPGIFVVDSKRWSGAISLDEGGLRHNGRRRDSAVTGAVEAARAIAELVGDLPASQVHPVLCFVRAEPISGTWDEVMMCSTSNVVDTLLSCPAVLAPQHVRYLAHQLRTRFGRPEPEALRRPRGRRTWLRGQLIRLAVVLAVVAVLAWRS